MTVAELVPGRVVHAPVSVRAGGVPVNAALAAAAHGARAAVVGRVGSDPAAGAIRAALDAAGVDALLAVDEEAPTGTFVETGSGEGKAVSADRGASARLVPADVPPALVAGAVLVSGHALLRDDTAPAARAALEAAEAPYVAVVAAAGGLVGGDFHERARGANVVLANEAEAEALTGLQLREAALALGELYDLAVVTAGPAGAVAAADGGLAVAGPSARAEGGRSGAGDAFAGVLLVSLAAGAELQAALEQACEAGRLALA